MVIELPTSNLVANVIIKYVIALYSIIIFGLLVSNEPTSVAVSTIPYIIYILCLYYVMGYDKKLPTGLLFYAMIAVIVFSILNLMLIPFIGFPTAKEKFYYKLGSFGDGGWARMFQYVCGTIVWFAVLTIFMASS